MCSNLQRGGSRLQQIETAATWRLWPHPAVRYVCCAGDAYWDLDCTFKLFSDHPNILMQPLAPHQRSSEPSAHLHTAGQPSTYLLEDRISRVSNHTEWNTTHILTQRQTRLFFFFSGTIFIWCYIYVYFVIFNVSAQSWELLFKSQ